MKNHGMLKVLFTALMLLAFALTVCGREGVILMG